MAKLLPPLVEGTIPAFYNNNGIVNITIPFTMNRAVSKTSVKGFSIKVKTAQNSTYLYSAEVTDIAYYNINVGSPYVILRINNDIREQAEFLNKLKEGQYYKFQIAYISSEDNSIGHFSTVTVGKYTYQPSIVEILNTNRNAISSRAYSYTGFYSNKDITERVYSYRFDLYDRNYDLCYTTGEQLHNSENDVTASESYDSCELLMELVTDQVYYLQYVVTTVNNLVIKSSRYRIAQRETLEPEINTNLIATVNNEDGYIELTYDGVDETSGSYMLMRSCSDSNFEIWDKMHTFRLDNNIPKELAAFRDFTFEQGKTYQYSLVQFNQYNLYSNRIYSNKVYADFEYAFLFDGVRQLKIKYNTKVASLKPVVLEQKVDTIGGQYPFIFRNGSVYYKEFSVSGLISFLSDENGLFLESAALIDNIREATPTKMELEYKSRTHPSAENFYKERNFKTEVINWLTNGETKLFRSPSEGNFIIRLTNTSLTPNDQLGRMLHTFTGTAYEIADFNYNNLVKYNFIRLQEAEQLANSIMYWKTIDLSTVTDFKNPFNTETVLTVSFTEMEPGTKLRIFLQSGSQTDIIIGSTGEYTIDKLTPIRSIYLLTPSNGKCTYSYYNNQATNFDVVANIYYLDVPAAQIIGDTDDVGREIGLTLKQGKTMVKNPKMELIKVYYFKATLRGWTPVFTHNKSFYVSPFNKDSELDKPNPILLYREVEAEKIKRKRDLNKDVADGRYLILEDKDFIVDPKVAEMDPSEIFHDFSKWSAIGRENDKWSGLGGSGTLYPIKYYYGGNFTLNQYDTTISLYYDEDEVNNPPHVIDLLPINEFYTDKIETLPTRVKVGSGVVIEFGYQLKVIDYVIETKDSSLANQKKTLDAKLTALNDYVTKGNSTVNRDLYPELLQDYKIARENFSKSVMKALQEEKEGV